MAAWSATAKADARGGPPGERRRAARECEAGRLGVSRVLARVDDLEVLAQEDLELLAVGGLDVRLVRCRGVAVGLRPHDRGVRVLALHGLLHLGLGLAGQRGLSVTGPAAVAVLAAAAIVGLHAARLERGGDDDDLQPAPGG